MIIRPHYLNLLKIYRDVSLVKILAGIRRCGKSTILEMLREDLLKSGIPEDHIISMRYTSEDFDDGMTDKEMYNGIKEEGYDCVGLRRMTRRGEPKVRSFFAKCYYKIINKISNTEIVDGARDFRLMTRQMVNSILELQENNRYSKGIFSWVGYNTKWLEYKNVERVAGVTKWSFFKLFAYSIESIIAFSTFPLILSILVGLFLLFISFIMIIMLFYFKTEFLQVCTLMVFLGGIQITFLGVIGLFNKLRILSKKRYTIKNGHNIISNII